ncbi:MAG: hypothetical protein U9R49_13030, partial [Bacteroidota bacterium]|nr:hypothetical protein [Bacteroidota bacterium]
MRKKPSLILLLLSTCLTGLFVACTRTNSVLSDQEDLLQYVDPFIGTGFHGHTFPGPSLPYGM